MLYHDKFMFNKFIKTTTIDGIYLLIVNLYMSFFSPYLGTLGWDEAAKGWFFALFGFATIVYAPILGTISDRIGRFRVIFFGLFVEAIVLLGYAYITNFYALFAIRLIASLSFASVTLTALSRVNDTADDTNRSRVTGLFLTLIAIPGFIAPLVGGRIAEIYGYQALFLTCFSLVVILILGLMIFDRFFYKKTTEKKIVFLLKDFNLFRDVGEVMRYVQLRSIAIIGFAANFSVPINTLILPFIVMERMGLDLYHLSITILIVHVVHSFQFILGHYAEKVGTGKSCLLGLSIYTAGLISLVFVNSFEVLLLVLLLQNLGGAFWNVSAWSYMSDIAERHNIEGKVLGSYSSLAKLASAISFIVSGILLVAIGMQIFWVYAGLIIIALLFNGRTLVKTALA